MKRLISILSILIAATTAQGQGSVSGFGAYYSSDTSWTGGQIVAPVYANTNVLLFLTADANGHFVLDTVIANVDSTIFATLYRLDSAKNNIRNEIAAKIPYTDTAGYLPTKTFLLNNYFAQGGSSFGTTATVGTNDAQPFDIETNNTARVRVFSNGNTAIGTTTDGGYKFQVNGTANIQNDLSFTKLSSTTTLTAAEILNHRYAVINATGAPGGYQGGLVIATGTNGGAVTNRYWFSRTGAMAIGTDMGLVVEGMLKPSLSIKCMSATPTGVYGGDELKLYTDDYNKYTYANGKIFAPLVMGGANGAQVPASTTAPTTAVGLGWRYHPLVNGWASDLVVWGHDDAGASVEIASFASRNSSLGIGVQEPTERLHVNGNIKTAQPTASGAGAFKIGKVLTGTDTNKYLEVEIDGVVWYFRGVAALP